MTAAAFLSQPFLPRLSRVDDLSEPGTQTCPQFLGRFLGEGNQQDFLQGNPLDQRQFQDQFFQCKGFPGSGGSLNHHGPVP